MRSILTATILSIFAMQAQAMENNIKPCSQEEYRRFFREFEEKGCDYHCRTEQLEKLAENFERKKDSLYLRALLCANRNPDGSRYQVSNVDVVYSVHKEGRFERRKYQYHFDTRVPFINKAIEKKNIDFLKIFFGLYSREGTTVITFAGHDQSRDFCSFAAEPDFGIFNQLEAIKDEGVAELMFAHLKQPVSLAVLLRCTALPFFAPGCKFALKKYQQDTDAALQDAAKQEQAKQAWEKSLHEVGK